MFFTASHAKITTFILKVEMDQVKAIKNLGPGRPASDRKYHNNISIKHLVTLIHIKTQV